MEKKHIFAPVMVFPVRRRLMGWTIAYLTGIFAANLIGYSVKLTVFVCAFSILLGIFRTRHRKSVFLLTCAAMFFIGNWLAGSRLSERDLATLPKTTITGKVDAIKYGNRIWLKNVVCGEEDVKTHRVLVTLMGDDTDAIQVGQYVSGIGRLFEPEEARNPGGINQRIYALARDYELSGYIQSGWTAEGDEIFSIREGLRRLREKLLEHLRGTFGESSPLFEAILLGERNSMDDEVVNAMRLTGTIHLLTVSGLHVTLLAGMLEMLLKKLSIRKRSRFAAETVFLCLFAGLTGAAAGTIRAVIMAAIRAWAKCRGRRYEPLTALSAAALFMTIYNPIWVLDASFQFSFSVVLGILLLRKRVEAVLMKCLLIRRSPHLRDLLCISFCAQMAALPMQLMFYGYISLVSLPMNLIAGVMMPFLMNGGLLCAVFSALIPSAKGLIAFCASAPIAVFEKVSIHLAEMGVFRLPAPYPWMIPAAFVAMALVGDAIRFGKGRRRAFIVMSVLLTVGYLCRFCPIWRYVQLDVGQGDAAVLRHGRQAVLIDVGKANGKETIRYLRHEGLYVDTVILSHLDEDHAGALKELMDSEIQIRRMILPSGLEESEACDTVRAGLDAAHEAGVEIIRAGAGERIEILGIQMDVLAPGDWKKKEDNDYSLVLYAEIENAALLLTGDSPTTSEKYDIPTCDVLKVSHHGSPYATSDAFIHQAKPRIALISVGRNSYGHPAQRVIDSLEENGAYVVRTDESGCITLWLGKRKMALQTYCASSLKPMILAYTR